MRKPFDMATDRLNRRLFVSDAWCDCIWKVDVDRRRSNVFLAGVGKPGRLSVMPDGRIVMPNQADRSLRVHDPTTGKRVSTIVLPANVERPQHAAATPHGTFVFSHGSSAADVHQLVEVTGDGVPVRVFGCAGAGTNALRHPYHFDIDESGNIAVADYGNGRVLLLDANLKLKCVLLNRSPEPFVNVPWRLCFDKDSGRLVVVMRSKAVTSVEMFSVRRHME